ncbi:Sec-independent protein translocase protein tatA/E-like protein [Clostridium sp. DL-VIII]|uniref:Sec-independent protein translocase subunit TatA/TatB n=1 Tax=Clostridium sp. DL-VIII TaxID=641107 RepID=UPI00023AF1A0|nr:twin-arginine translocase TatA/TatE family subunit [Clostridium sp. DL-VIII]EHI97611.1 Sec-independent protein translocase protein tatA/E-like protein [Clostridium sp. DL-VIII]
MLGDISITKLILILVVALVIFGPGKLPEIGKSLGKSIGEFKDALNKTEASIKKEINDKDDQSKP